MARQGRCHCDLQDPTEYLEALKKKYMERTAKLQNQQMELESKIMQMETFLGRNQTPNEMASCACSFKQVPKVFPSYGDRPERDVPDTAKADDKPVHCSFFQKMMDNARSILSIKCQCPSNQTSAALTDSAPTKDSEPITDLKTESTAFPGDDTYTKSVTYTGELTDQSEPTTTQPSCTCKKRKQKTQQVSMDSTQGKESTSVSKIEDLPNENLADVPEPFEDLVMPEQQDPGTNAEVQAIALTENKSVDFRQEKQTTNKSVTCCCPNKDCPNNPQRLVCKAKCSLRKDGQNQCAFVGSPLLVNTDFEQIPTQTSAIPIEDRKKSSKFTSDSQIPCVCDPEARKAAGVSLLSLNSKDAVEMQTIADLVRKEKDIKQQIEVLHKRERAFQNASRSVDRLNPIPENACCHCRQGANNIEAEITKVSQELRLENNILKSELMDLKMELKHCLEKVEGPMKQKLETEKLKCEQFQRELQSASKNMVINQDTYAREMNQLKMQLCCACNSISELNQMNTRLKDEMAQLDCLCTKLEDDLIKQKIDEAETIKRLTNRRPNKEPSAKPLEDLTCDSSLAVVARKLSKTIKELAPCDDCSTLPPEVTGAAKCIKELTDLVLKRRNKQPKQHGCSCQREPPSRTYQEEECCSCCAGDAGEPKLSSPEEKPVTTLLSVPDTFVQKGTSSKFDVGQAGSSYYSARGAPVKQVESAPTRENRGIVTGEGRPCSNIGEPCRKVKPEKESTKDMGVVSESKGIETEEAKLERPCSKIGEPCQIVKDVATQPLATMESQGTTTTEKRSRGTLPCSDIGVPCQEPPGTDEGTIPTKQDKACKAPCSDVLTPVKDQQASRMLQSGDAAPSQETEKIPKTTSAAEPVSGDTEKVTEEMPVGKSTPTSEERVGEPLEVLVKVEPETPADETIEGTEEQPESVDAIVAKHEIDAALAKEEGIHQEPSQLVTDEAPIKEEGASPAPEDIEEGTPTAPEYIGGVPTTPEDIMKGAPTAPEDIIKGAPTAPEDIIEGAPAAPEDIIEGTPTAPEDIIEGAPAAPEDIIEGTPTAPEYIEEGAPAAPEDIEIRVSAPIEEIPSGVADFTEPPSEQPDETFKDAIPKESVATAGDTTEEVEVESRPIVSYDGAEILPERASELMGEQVEAPSSLPTAPAEQDDVVKQEITEPTTREVPFTEDRVGEFPYDVETKAYALDQPPSGLHLTTAITTSGNLEVITEGPEGTIQTTLTYNDEGNIVVETQMVDYGEEGSPPDESSPDAIRAEPTSSDSQARKPMMPIDSSRISGPSGPEADTPYTPSSATAELTSQLNTSSSGVKGALEKTSDFTSYPVVAEGAEGASVRHKRSVDKPIQDDAAEMSDEMAMSEEPTATGMEIQSGEVFTPDQMVSEDESILPLEAQPELQDARAGQQNIEAVASQARSEGKAGEVLAVPEIPGKLSVKDSFKPQDSRLATSEGKAGSTGEVLSVPEIPGKLSVADSLKAQDGGLATSEGKTGSTGEVLVVPEIPGKLSVKDSLKGQARASGGGLATLSAGESISQKPSANKGDIVSASSKADTSGVTTKSIMEGGKVDGDATISTTPPHTIDCGCQSKDQKHQSCQCCECKEIGITTSGDKETTTEQEETMGKHPVSDIEDARDETDSEFVTISETTDHAAAQDMDTKKIGDTLEDFSTLTTSEKQKDWDVILDDQLLAKYPELKGKSSRERDEIIQKLGLTISTHKEGVISSGSIKEQSGDLGRLEALPEEPLIPIDESILNEYPELAGKSTADQQQILKDLGYTTSIPKKLSERVSIDPAMLEKHPELIGKSKEEQAAILKGLGSKPSAQSQQKQSVQEVMLKKEVESLGYMQCDPSGIVNAESFRSKQSAQEQQQTLEDVGYVITVEDNIIIDDDMLQQHLTLPGESGRSGMVINESRLSKHSERAGKSAQEQQQMLEDLGYVITVEDNVIIDDDMLQKYSKLSGKSYEEQQSILRSQEKLVKEFGYSTVRSFIDVADNNISRPQELLASSQRAVPSQIIERGAVPKASSEVKDMGHGVVGQLRTAVSIQVPVTHEAAASNLELDQGRLDGEIPASLRNAATKVDSVSAADGVTSMQQIPSQHLVSAQDSISASKTASMKDARDTVWPETQRSSILKQAELEVPTRTSRQVQVTKSVSFEKSKIPTIPIMSPEGTPLQVASSLRESPQITRERASGVVSGSKNEFIQELVSSSEVRTPREPSQTTKDKSFEAVFESKVSIQERPVPMAEKLPSLLPESAQITKERTSGVVAGSQTTQDKSFEAVLQTKLSIQEQAKSSLRKLPPPLQESAQMHSEMLVGDQYVPIQEQQVSSGAETTASLRKLPSSPEPVETTTGKSSGVLIDSKGVLVQEQLISSVEPTRPSSREASVSCKATCRTVATTDNINSDYVDEVATQSESKCKSFSIQEKPPSRDDSASCKASCRTISVQSSRAKVNSKKEVSKYMAANTESSSSWSSDVKEKEKQKYKLGEVPSIVSEVSDKERPLVQPVTKSKPQRKKRYSSARIMDCVRCQCTEPCNCAVCSPDASSRDNRSLRRQSLSCYCPPPNLAMDPMMPQVKSHGSHPSGCTCNQCYCRPCTPCPPPYSPEYRSQYPPDTNYPDVTGQGEFSEVKRHDSKCECVDCLCFPKIKKLAETKEYPVVFDKKQVYQFKVNCNCANAQNARKNQQPKSRIPISTSSPNPPKVKSESRQMAGPSKTSNQPVQLSQSGSVYNSIACDCEACACAECPDSKKVAPVPTRTIEPTKSQANTKDCCCPGPCTCQPCPIDVLTKKLRDAEAQLTTTLQQAAAKPSTSAPAEDQADEPCGCQECTCPGAANLTKSDEEECTCKECVCPGADKMGVKKSRSQPDRKADDVLPTQKSQSETGPTTASMGDEECTCTECVCPQADKMGQRPPSSAEGAGDEECDCAVCACPGSTSLPKKGSNIPDCDCSDCQCSPCADPKKETIKTKPSRAEPPAIVLVGPEPPAGPTAFACDCADCKCEPCTDPTKLRGILSAKTPSQMRPAPSAKAVTIEQHPADCSCPICKCGEGDGQLPEVKSELPGVRSEKIIADHPEEVAAESKSTGMTKKGDHPPDCTCPECLCLEGELPAQADIGIQPASDKAVHSLACVCPQCLCPECTVTATHAPGCRCVQCLCTPCDYQSAENVSPKKSVLASQSTGTPPTGTDCSCIKCYCDVCSKAGKQSKAGLPPSQSQRDSGCTCIECLCSDCITKLQSMAHEEGCKCSECLCDECLKKLKDSAKLVAGKQSVLKSTQSGPSSRYKSTSDDNRGINCTCEHCMCIDCKGLDTPKPQPHPGVPIQQDQTICKCSVCVCDPCEKSPLIPAIAAAASKQVSIKDSKLPSVKGSERVMSVKQLNSKTSKASGHPSYCSCPVCQCPGAPSGDGGDSSLEPPMFVPPTRRQCSGEKCDCIICVDKIAPSLTLGAKVPSQVGSTTQKTTGIVQPPAISAQLADVDNPPFEVVTRIFCDCQRCDCAICSDKSGDPLGKQPSVHPSAQIATQPSVPANVQIGTQPSVNYSAQVGIQASVVRSVHPSGQIGTQVSILRTVQVELQPSVPASAQIGIQPGVQPGMPGVPCGCQPCICLQCVSKGSDSAGATPTGAALPCSCDVCSCRTCEGETNTNEIAKKTTSVHDGQCTCRHCVCVECKGVETDKNMANFATSPKPSTLATQPNSQPMSIKPSVRIIAPSDMVPKAPSAQISPSVHYSQQFPQTSGRMETVASVHPSAQIVPQASLHPSAQIGPQQSAHPSAQLATQNSVHASAQLVAQPSFHPSAQIALQPSVHPSGQIGPQASLHPSAQIALQPSVHPSAQIGPQASLHPSAQIALQPSVHPSAQIGPQASLHPSAQIALQPSVHPSAQIGPQASLHPSAQIALQPSVHPSAQIGPQASLHPSAQIALQPSVPPSAQIDPQASLHPSAQIGPQSSAHPSAQLATQTSIHASAQLVAQPSFHPSAQIAPQPSVHPSAQIGPQASLQPSAQIDPQSSVHPSVQFATQTSIHASAQIDTQPSAHPSTQLALQPSVHPSAQIGPQPSLHPSAQIDTQPSAQASLHPSAQIDPQSSVHPSVQFATQTSIHASAQIDNQPSVHPSTQLALQPSVHPSAQIGPQPSLHPSAQIDTQPSAHPSTQLATQPSVHPSAQIVPQLSIHPSAQVPVSFVQGPPCYCPTSPQIATAGSQTIAQTAVTGSIHTSVHPSAQIASTSQNVVDIPQILITPPDPQTSAHIGVGETVKPGVEPSIQIASYNYPQQCSQNAVNQASNELGSKRSVGMSKPSVRIVDPTEQATSATGVQPPGVQIGTQASAVGGVSAQPSFHMDHIQQQSTQIASMHPSAQIGMQASAPTEIGAHPSAQLSRPVSAHPSAQIAVPGSVHVSAQQVSPSSVHTSAQIAVPGSLHPSAQQIRPPSAYPSTQIDVPVSVHTSVQVSPPSVNVSAQIAVPGSLHPSEQLIRPPSVHPSTQIGIPGSVHANTQQVCPSGVHPCTPIAVPGSLHPSAQQIRPPNVHPSTQIGVSGSVHVSAQEVYPSSVHPSAQIEVPGSLHPSAQQINPPSVHQSTQIAIPSSVHASAQQTFPSSVHPSAQIVVPGSLHPSAQQIRPPSVHPSAQIDVPGSVHVSAQVCPPSVNASAQIAVPASLHPSAQQVSPPSVHPSAQIGIPGSVHASAQQVFPSSVHPSAQIAVPASLHQSAQQVSPPSVHPSAQIGIPGSVHASAQQVFPSSVHPSAQIAVPTSLHPSAQQIRPPSVHPSAQIGVPGTVQVSAQQVCPCSLHPSTQIAVPGSLHPSAQQIRPPSVHPSAQIAIPGSVHASAQQVGPSSLHPSAQIDVPGSLHPSAQQIRPPSVHPSAQIAIPGSVHASAQQVGPSSVHPSAQIDVPGSLHPSAQQIRPPSVHPSAQIGVPGSVHVSAQQVCPSSLHPSTQIAVPGSLHPSAQQIRPPSVHPSAQIAIPGSVHASAQQVGPSSVHPSAQIDVPGSLHPSAQQIRPPSVHPSAQIGVPGSVHVSAQQVCPSSLHPSTQIAVPGSLHPSAQQIRPPSVHPSAQIAIPGSVHASALQVGPSSVHPSAQIDVPGSLHPSAQQIRPPSVHPSAQIGVTTSVHASAQVLTSSVHPSAQIAVPGSLHPSAQQIRPPSVHPSAQIGVPGSVHVSAQQVCPSSVHPSAQIAVPGSLHPSAQQIRPPSVHPSAQIAIPGSVHASAQQVGPSSVHPSAQIDVPGSLHPSAQQIRPPSVHPSAQIGVTTSVHASAQVLTSSVHPSAQIASAQVLTSSVHPSAQIAVPGSLHPSAQQIRPPSAHPSAQIGVPGSVHAPGSQHSTQIAQQLPIICDCPECSCEEGLLNEVQLSTSPSAGVGTTSRISSKAITQDTNQSVDTLILPKPDLKRHMHPPQCDCADCVCKPCADTGIKGGVSPRVNTNISLKDMDASALKQNIDAIIKENQQCRSQITEIKQALESIKCACTEAEIRTQGPSKTTSSKAMKPFVKQAAAFGQTMSGLKMALKNLQSKCKAKDRMIGAMTTELELRQGPEVFDKILTMSQGLSQVLDYDQGEDVKSTDRSQVATNILFGPTNAGEITTAACGCGPDVQSRGVEVRTHKHKKKKDKLGCPCSKPQLVQKEDKDCQILDPNGFEVIDIRRITEDSLIVKWTKPKYEQIIGYDLFVNGTLASKVMSSVRTSAMMHSLDLSRTVQITIYAVTKCGRIEPPAIAIYEIDSKTQ